MKHRAYDILGNVAIVNFPREFKSGAKKKFANKILKDNKSVKTVLEKTGRVKGRLRKISTKYVAGEKTKEVLYKENNCMFRFNIDTTYFSSRLSNERKEIAKKIKRGDNVLVMFAGVAPFSIVIAKNSKAKKVVSVEINREANKYAQLNVELNKVKKIVDVVQGDVKRFTGKIGSLRSQLNGSVPDICQGTSVRNKLSRKNSGVNSVLAKKSGRADFGAVIPKFDVIVMARPQLKDTFLKDAFRLSKKGTRIYYYDFCKEDEVDLIVEKIKSEAKKARKKIKILKTKKAGEIAPYKIRVRVDFRVL